MIDTRWRRLAGLLIAAALVAVTARDARSDDEWLVTGRYNTHMLSEQVASCSDGLCFDCLNQKFSSFASLNPFRGADLCEGVSNVGSAIFRWEAELSHSDWVRFYILGTTAPYLQGKIDSCRQNYGLPGFPGGDVWCSSPSGEIIYGGYVLDAGKSIQGIMQYFNRLEIGAPVWYDGRLYGSGVYDYMWDDFRNYVRMAKESDPEAEPWAIVFRGACAWYTEVTSGEVIDSVHGGGTMTPADFAGTVLANSMAYWQFWAGGASEYPVLAHIGFAPVPFGSEAETPTWCFLIGEAVYDIIQVPTATEATTWSRVKSLYH